MVNFFFCLVGNWLQWYGTYVEESNIKWTQNIHWIRKDDTRFARLFISTIIQWLLSVMVQSRFISSFSTQIVVPFLRFHFLIVSWQKANGEWRLAMPTTTTTEKNSLIQDHYMTTKISQLTNHIVIVRKEYKRKKHRIINDNASNLRPVSQSEPMHY